MSSEVTVERLSFFSDGFKLAGILYRAASPPVSPGPAVVVSGGFTNLKEVQVAAVAQRYAERGYVALTFDYRGFGESEGPRCRLIPLEQVEDIRNAATYLRQRSDVDGRRVGVHGWSLGGAAAVYAAAIDPRIRALVCTVGIGDGGRWMRGLRRLWEWHAFLERLEADRVRRVLTGESEFVERFEVMVPDPHSVDYLGRTLPDELKARKCLRVPLITAEKIIEFKPESVVHQIAPRASLFLHSGADTLVSPDESRSLYEKAGEPKKLVIFEGAPHFDVYHGPIFERIMAEAVAWVEEHMPAPTQDVLRERSAAR